MRFEDQNFMKMKKYIFILPFMFISLFATYAQERWTVEWHGGEVYNLPLPLTISQQGYPDIKLTARYYTDALFPPIYWNLRLSHWKNVRSWEFELVHHKLYLDNTTPEVQKFNISHGFNMITINRGYDIKTWQCRAGAGIVLTHPESRIRGKEFGSTGDDFDLGYFVSGPVLNFAIGKSYRTGNRFFFYAEAKTTLAYAYIPISQGHAKVVNIAFHIVLGLGYDFIKPHKENI